FHRPKGFAPRRRGGARSPRRHPARLLLSASSLPPSRAERRLDDRERALAADIIDGADAEHRVQLLGRHLHRPGSGSTPRRRLREGRRPRRIERDIALDLLLDLMDVAVEHRHRAKALQIAEGAWRVLGAPAPFLIDRPQRQMREHDDWRAGREPFDVFLHPFELLVAELGEARGFEAGREIEDVDEGNEVYAAVIEAVPALALRPFAVAV